MNEWQKELSKRLEAREEEMIKHRRYLHQHPELSFQEEKTAKYISDFYEGKDCIVQTNFGDGYGILVDIEGGKPGRNIAIRADFDALPIHEDTGLPFASEVDGVMHACGHDAHTAYMLILADTLIEMKDQLPGKIRVIHQPAEETPPGGALGMIKAGCLEGYDHVLGAHIMSNNMLGEVACREDKIMAGRTNFKIVMHGKSGHGSMPQDANDAIVAAAQFVTAIQTIVSRRINPFDMAVVTIGSFDGKGSANVVKDTVELVGDIRIMTEKSRDIVEREFKKILAGICETFGITYELDYLHDYPVLVNDSDLTKMVVRASKDANFERVNQVIESDPLPASEDFAYFANERPGCFFFVGCTKEGDEFYPHHHPKFMVHEDSILITAQVMGNAVLEYLFNGVK